MKAVAIALEGVLRKPLDVESQDFGASLLYQSLVDHFRVLILGTPDSEKDAHWLTTNGFIKHVKVEPERLEDAPTESGRRKVQLSRLRAEGFRFEFAVVADPAMAEELYRYGTPVLLYLHPEYSAKAFRPDYDGGETRPWAELVKEVEYTRTTRAQQRKREEEANV